MEVRPSTRCLRCALEFAAVSDLRAHWRDVHGGGASTSSGSDDSDGSSSGGSSGGSADSCAAAEAHASAAAEEVRAWLNAGPRTPRALLHDAAAHAWWSKRSGRGDAQRAADCQAPVVMLSLTHDGDYAAAVAFDE